MSHVLHQHHIRCEACGAAAIVSIGLGTVVFCGCGVALADTTDPSSQPANQTTTSVSVAAPARAERHAVPSAARAAGTQSARAATAQSAAAPARTPINALDSQSFYAAAPATAALTNVPGTGGGGATPVAPATSGIALSAVTSAGRDIEMLATAAAAQPVRRVAAVRAVAAAVTTISNVLIEGETFRLSPVNSGSVFSDKNASGGRALLMSTNGTASTTVTTPDFTSLVIRARGDQYKGAPTMTVSVDGKVVSTVAVPATGWTNYTVPVAGAAGTHTIAVAYTNDLRASAGKDRNLRIDTLTVVAATVTPPPSTTAPYFQSADWLWKPIGANPTLAANSATWVGYFSAPGTQHVTELHQEGTTLIRSTAVTSSTPRYDVRFTKAWGADPFGSYTVPIPTGTVVPHQGGDAHLAVMDPTTGQVFGLWQANYSASTNTWTASWGGMTPINGNGVDTSGSATGSNISRFAGVVTADEMTAAIQANTGVNHALVFATDIAGPGFVGPATKSDGNNPAGVATPIPEGYRIQLDPSINVDALPGLTPGEKVIAKTLQTYGAYVIDKGGARMSFSFEAVPDGTDSNPGKAWTDAGFAWDYYDMSHIPWSSLRVLAP